MRLFWVTIIGIFSLGLNSFGDEKEWKDFNFPFEEAGLTRKQAAAHLLNRFTYGATPALVDDVAVLGLEKWFADQLLANDEDIELQRLLAPYDALQMNNAEIVRSFPKPFQVRLMAANDGIVLQDSTADKKENRQRLQKYMQDHSLRPEKELVEQVASQKIMRAAYSKNQLQEVLTSFWFNHFNVSFAKNTCGQFILSYERDVIRPNALGKFGDLLLATAKSPAMLTYLDNFNSSVSKTSAKAGGKRQSGLNENYAREVMELHTLGVDGGYTQNDVTEAARILTGWTIFPLGKAGGKNEMMQKLRSASPAELQQRGIVRDHDFVFLPNRHDQDAKVVMGKHFPPHGGYEEGIELLDMLAHHPSTAQFICKKIATRFVKDNPTDALVKRMAKTFSDEDGDIRKILITMVSSPEFWHQDAVREKTKSPFEVMASAIRVLDATITDPKPLVAWCARMGEKFYFYQAPTGFPDQGSYWISTGSLLARMNFGLAIAAGKIPGIEYDVLQLNKNHEPESASEALTVYCDLLMPQRDHRETIQRLSPLLNEPDLEKKVKKAAAEKDTIESVPDDNIPTDVTESKAVHEYNLLQVIGIILGSPEFQRR